jgi:hypothetical protein
MFAYVFDTEAEATTGVAGMEEGMRGLAAAQGYELDEHGHAIGVNAETRLPRPDACHTEAWDIPRELTDGRWAIKTYRVWLALEYEGVPLYAMVDAQITVPWTYEDVTELIPPDPEE